MKRALSLLLAALMLAGTLTACAGDGTPTETTASPSADTTATPETTSPTHDAEGYLLDSLPADLSFGGEQIGILTWSDFEMQEFEAEEITGEIVNDAIFRRNATVENRLGIDIEWYGTKGNASNNNNYLTVARNSYNTGDGAYDIYASYSRTAANCAVNGLCYNLMDVDYLDFEKPWWPERLLETATIGNKLYFISGDISTNVLHFMNGTTLMCLNRAYLAARRLRDVTFSYGILPAPKYDESQQGYVTVMGNPFTLYCITRDCDDPDRAAAVLEAMASAAHRTTTPAIFETNMKVKYSDTDINAQMYDIIRESVNFDLGRLYADSINYPVEKLCAVIWQGGNWASPAKTYEKMMSSMVKKMVDKLREIE